VEVVRFLSLLVPPPPVDRLKEVGTAADISPGGSSVTATDPSSSAGWLGPACPALLVVVPLQPAPACGAVPITNESSSLPPAAAAGDWGDRAEMAAAAVAAAADLASKADSLLPRRWLPLGPPGGPVATDSSELR
jgi:hypothetical protein